MKNIFSKTHSTLFIYLCFLLGLAFLYNVVYFCGKRDPAQYLSSVGNIPEVSFLCDEQVIVWNLGLDYGAPCLFCLRQDNNAFCLSVCLTHLLT